MKKRNKYSSKKTSCAPKKPLRTVVGVLSGNSRGFAFLSCGEKDDIFIPAKSLRGAIHGDTVEIDVYADHGEVVRILKNGVSTLTGTFVIEMRAAKVIPDDRHFSHDIYVTHGKASVGDRVVVKLSRKDRSKGEIVEVLGKAGTLDADVTAAIYSLGIEDFKQKVIKETDEAAAQEIVVDGRVDFTDQPCFTIDGEGSKDFDDAVYATKTESGYRLWVHIADVAHYVPRHSHTDKEAFRRGNSFYYGESVIPMLPETLCNGVCSLNENENRYTLTAIMDITSGGEIVSGEICQGVIRSHKRMTYEKVELALNGKTDEYNQFMPTLTVLKELRDALKKRRDSDGNIDFDISEPKFTFEYGVVVDVKKAPRLTAHSIIEECMIAANRFVASTFMGQKAPFIYREHEQPTPEKIESLNVFLKAMGLREVKPSSQSIATLLRSAPEDKKSAISKMALRSMSKAKYVTKSSGHFGLSIKEYTHFTSPIRRYSDLAIHRVIKSYLKGESLDTYKSEMESAASQASERERLCERVEREIDELYIADYMSQFVGKKFDGIISGVTEWGIYVELDNTAEGMIRAESLGVTTFIPESMSISVRGKGIFSLGDTIKVKLVDAVSGNIQFELA